MNLSKLALKRPIFITCLMFLVIILGLISIKRIGVDLFPDVTFPIVVVQTQYPGAGPADIENLISQKIEDEIGSLAQLKKINSISLESVSWVVAEFSLGTDVKYVEQQIRNRIDNIRNTLPKEIEGPFISRVDPADLPIIRLAVQSPLPSSHLYNVIKDQIALDLQRVDGVGKVSIVGARKREIKVLVDKQKMETTELSVLSIAQALQGSSRNIPLGSFDRANKETLYRGQGEFTSPQVVRDVVLKLIDRPIRVEDVATVVDGEEKAKSHSLLNGIPSIFVDIYKQSGTNTVEVADLVLKRIDQINTKLAQQKIKAKISLIRDSAHYIRLSVRDVNEAILIGIFLCVVVVFLFLGSYKSTFITGLALPNSLLGAFILMHAMGFTINMMTLLALSLAVGLLIDDAIVVRENIFRHIQKGTAPLKAAKIGTAEVALAVIATTAVVISVFGPIAFLDGIIGQFFKQFGLTIVFAMLISTLDAFTIAPMLSAYWIQQKKQDVTSAFEKQVQGWQDKLEDAYGRLLKLCLRYRKTTILSSFLLFFASLALIPFLPSNFIPEEDYGEFNIRLELPLESSLEASRAALHRLDRILAHNPDIRTRAAVAGTGSAPNTSLIYIQLVERKKRHRSTSATKEYYRKILPPLFAGANVRVEQYDEFGDNGMRPFMILFSGQNLEELAQFTNQVKQRFQKVPGLVDVDTNYRRGKPEFHVRFNREAAQERGVNLAQAQMELRARIDGVVATQYREENKEYDVRVELTPRDKDLRHNFATTTLPNLSNNFVPLAQISVGQEIEGHAEIRRQNSARYVAVTADLASNGALGQLMGQAAHILTTELRPPAGISWEFEGMSQDFQDLIRQMLLSIAFAIVLIYMVLASLYNSFIIPFAILLALPMAVCGALAALFMTGEGINIYSLIGLILLLGIVAKNSILLVDLTLQLMNEQGLRRTQALVVAAKTRLRPILMTTIALIAGTIPVAVGLSEVSAPRVSMGIAIIGGLVSSTLLTLLIVPAAFGYIDDFRIWLRRKVILLREGQYHLFKSQ